MLGEDIQALIDMSAAMTLKEFLTVMMVTAFTGNRSTVL